MSETQTMYVVLSGGDYVCNAGTGSTSKYLYQAELWLTKESAEWWISVMARNWDPPYTVKPVKMTMEDDDG